MREKRTLVTVAGRQPRRFRRAIGLVLLSALLADMAAAGLAGAEEPKNGRKTRKGAAGPADPAATPPAPVGSTDTPDAYYARKRGTVALNTGHYEEAVKAFEEAYALNQDPALLFNLAQAYRLAGQPGKALDACSSFLRSANATDRAQVERFMAELGMIVFQIRTQKDSRPLPTPPSAPESIAPPALEPPPLATSARVEKASKPPALDLTPRPQAIATVDLTTSPPDPGPAQPFYRRTGFWVLAGGTAAALAAGAVLLWYFERPHGPNAPTTTLGYQQAFP
jgi:tetratricopeptide (TPR) repeat protein